MTPVFNCITFELSGGVAVRLDGWLGAATATGRQRR